MWNSVTEDFQAFHCKDCTHKRPQGATYRNKSCKLAPRNGDTCGWLETSSLRLNTTLAPVVMVRAKMLLRTFERAPLLLQTTMPPPTTTVVLLDDAHRLRLLLATMPPHPLDDAFWLLHPQAVVMHPHPHRHSLLRGSCAKLVVQNGLNLLQD